MEEADSIDQPVSSEPATTPVDSSSPVESPSKSEDSTPAVPTDLPAEPQEVPPVASDLPAEPASMPETTPSIESSSESPSSPLNSASESKPPAVENSEPEAPAKSSSAPLLVGLVLFVSLLVTGVLVYKNVSDQSAYQTESEASRGRGSGHQAPVVQKADPQSVILEQESDAVDREVNTLDGDLAEVDEAINDQPEDLSKEE